MKNKCKVVILDAIEPNVNMLCFGENKLWFIEKEIDSYWKLLGGSELHKGAFTNIMYTWKPKHMYIVSEDEIFKADHYIHSGTSANSGDYKTLNTCHEGLHQHKNYESLVNPKFGKHTLFIDGMFHTDCKKIIATTNPELNLPLIPIELVKAYSKNVIDEIFVNYEEYFTNDSPFPKYRPLEVNNTILIELCKDIFPKQEVIALFEKLEKDRSRFYAEDAADILPLSEWLKNNI